MSRGSSILRGLLLGILLWSSVGCQKEGSSTGSGVTNASNVASIAGTVSDGIGRVVQSYAGNSGVPVIVLEERHNSRIGQVQHAIALVRLHDKYRLRNIALEGYLKESPAISTEWFTKAVTQKTPEARARVAVRFLKQGEISAAEFMKLVYSDVSILPTETGQTYNSEPPRDLPPLDYLEKIGNVDPSWAKEKGKAYESVESIQRLTGDDHLKLAKEIKQYAQDKLVPITSNEQQQMDKFIEFWERRMGSNRTIVETATAISAGDQGAIAANVGAFHTQGVCQLLKAAGRSYAVVTPLYDPHNASHGDLTDGMYDRKNKNLPVFSTGLSALILKEVTRSKKPQPVLPETFFQAEAELYAFTTNISEAVLGPPNPPRPPNGGSPPFGLSGSDFDGEWTRINPALIQLLPGADDRRRAVLFPVEFKKTGKTIWVASVWGRGEEAGQDTVEKMLQHALQEINTEAKTPEKAEDTTGKIQMSVNTFAIVGPDRTAVQRAILREA